MLNFMLKLMFKLNKLILKNCLVYDLYRMASHACFVFEFDNFQIESQIVDILFHPHSCLLG